MITPRKDFKSSTHAKGWQSLMDSNQFQTAVKAALVEMDIKNSSPTDIPTAASYTWRKAGALQFLSILMNLTATDTTPKTPGRPNLDHNA